MPDPFQSPKTGVGDSIWGLLDQLIGDKIVLLPPDEQVGAGDPGEIGPEARRPSSITAGGKVGVGTAPSQATAAAIDPPWGAARSSVISPPKELPTTSRRSIASFRVSAHSISSNP